MIPVCPAWEHRIIAEGRGGQPSPPSSPALSGVRETGHLGTSYLE